MIRTFTFLVLISCLNFGCSTTIKRIEQETLPPEFVDEKNYTIGQSMEVNVGDTVIRRRKYVLAKWIRKDMVVPDRDCVIRASAPLIGNTTTTLRNGIPVRMAGEIKIKNRSFILLPLGKPNPTSYVPWYAPIDAITKTAMDKPSWTSGFGGQIQGGKLIIDPPETIFETYVEEKVVESKAQAKVNSTYINFDITYTGTSNNQINLTYREYDKLDRARTAFFQNLQYQVSDGKAKIQFRDISMSVNDVNNQSINFTVLKDDSSKESN